MKYRRRTLLVGLAACGGFALTGCKLTPAKRAEAGATSAPQSATPRGRILFIKNGQLWHWHDGKVEAIASHARFADPAWSPEGDRIAVVQMGTNHSDIFVYDAQSMSAEQVTEHFSNVDILESAWARKPAWSPEGERLVYVSDYGGYQGGVPVSDMALWVADAPGGRPRKILPQAPFSHGVDWPTWSPDGSEIAYTIHDNGRSRVEVLTLANGARRTVTAFEGGAYDPAWSPDGNRLAFVFREGRRHVIALTDGEGNDVVRLVETDMARAPAWSPDGQFVAYVALNGQHFDIYAVAVPTGPDQDAAEPKRLTDNQQVEAQSGISWTA